MNEPEPLPDDLRRWCIKCRQEIDAKRVLRGSVTCGSSCYNADRKARRKYRASKFCRLCGRGGCVTIELRREDAHCYYCGQMIGRKATIDHQQPQSKGGGETDGNLVNACASCNSRKGSRTVDEYRVYLEKITGEPVAFWGEIAQKPKRAVGRESK